jgi:hypothetical protein
MVQSPAPSSQPPRSAITLTEVLISMGILTLGLLGVAALFPVGGFYMQKADIADRGSAIAQSVMSELVSRGMLNPRSWYVVVPENGSNAWNATFPSDGKYSPGPHTVKRSTFTRPFALTLAEALTQPAFMSSQDPSLIGQQFGSAFVLDPIGVAAMAFWNDGAPLTNKAVPANNWVNGPASIFPGAAYNALSTNKFYPTTSAWGAWVETSGSSGPSGMWPVRRVTFRESSTGWHLGPTMAEHYCRASDDLATELPPRDDRPALQTWDWANFGGSPQPLARQWAGDYSWLVTVAPTTNAARDGMARNPEGHEYDVSVVVFHKRVLPLNALTVLESSSGQPEYLQTMSENERAVRASVMSTSLNGGELLLTDIDNASKDPFANLKSGNWIMLCGPHPNSKDPDSPQGEPRFSLNWYQVVSIEGRETRLNNQGTESPAPLAGEPARRVVTVRGPQWPWTPSTNPSNISNNLCVAICRGAVAVHAKTLRLEKNTMSFGASGSITKTPYPWGPG